MGKTHFDTAPEHITIVAGPSFGQALKFMAFGAAMGAGAVYYFLSSKGSGSAAKTASLQDVVWKYEAAVEDFGAQGEAASGDVAERLSSLAGRLKSIGSRAKDLVETAAEAVKPTLENAVAEGKKAAAEVQTKLKKDVEEAGDKPAIAEQDGDLPSEKEDKFVE
ncbi:MAG: hypothetical protein KY445_05815 [Armatimonadetes bacterium]|nr:hypothetical protein [Armatimonadota bacterium]